PAPDDILGARRQQVDAIASNLRKDMRDLLARRRTRLGELDARLARHSPRAELARRQGELRQLLENLARLGAAIAPARAEVLAQRAARLQRAMENRLSQGRERIANRRQELAALHARLGPAVLRHVAARREKFQALEKLRASLGYENVLARGFALVRDVNEAPLRSAGAVTAGQKLVIQFSDGRRRAIAEGEATVSEPKASAPPAGKPPRKPSRKPSSAAKQKADQGSLF
ncbi:MAG: exodeoxyribonuclease VII large subunit, partial [Rhodoblastus sp.]